MRIILTALILCALNLSAQDSAVGSPEPAHPAEQVPLPLNLLNVAAGFSGAESLEQLRTLLQEGEDANVQDSEGNTPLLHLCAPIEMDYRYTTDPHFAKAVDDAIVLLLQHRANILLENRKGCNAAFYLQSKPELIKRLSEENLLPKELAVRIPYESMAFYSYIRKRTEQATLTSHEPCREYLIRKYCAPAYERAEKRLTDMISTESTRRFSYPAVCDLLAFMRLADRERAAKFVNELNYWEHGEHFLEEKPSQVLDALNLLEWDVDPAAIRKALKKLDTMLPTSPDEMIDCFAAQPMGILLEMLERQQGDDTLPLIQKYAGGNEAELAYRAYKLLLRRQNLPLPTPEALEQAFSTQEAPGSTAMTPEQRKIYECAVVDTALNSGDISSLNIDIVKRVVASFNSMKLRKHAAIVSELITAEGSLTADPYTIQAAHHRYIEQPPPSPRMIMSRYILEHPAQFATPPAEER